MGLARLSSLVPLIIVCPLVAACGGAASSARSDAIPAAQAATPHAAPDGPPAAAPTTGAVAIDCGDFHTCALLADGTVQCWGRAAHGEAGPPAVTDRVAPTPVDGVRDAIAITTGAAFTCALLKDKTVRCWGSGRLLGDGIARENLPPTKVPGLGGVEQIRGAGLLTCARLASGGVRCWGLEGDRRRRAASADLAELGAAVTDIAAASAHACARGTDGGVRCWGDFAWAMGAAPAMRRPRISDAVQIASGDDFECAVTKSETVRCWGRNDDGQLGVTPDEDVHVAPVEIAGVAGAAGIATGEGEACAVLKDGTVRCWGANAEGELGFGTRTTSELPQRVEGLSGVRDVCLGSLHACALTSSGEVYCWGGNPSGQVGDGTRERRLRPTAVGVR
jgi:alpha-tubulin suppressor-like RCC1 family protein